MKYEHNMSPSTPTEELTTLRYVEGRDVVEIRYKGHVLDGGRAEMVAEARMVKNCTLATLPSDHWAVGTLTKPIGVTITIEVPVGKLTTN